MVIAILLIIFFLWIIALTYAIRASSADNIYIDVNELRQVKLDKIHELQRMSEAGLIATDELDNRVKAVMSACNIKALK